MKANANRVLVAKRRLKLALLRLPSGRWFPGKPGRRRCRLLAVTMVRNESRFLPGLLRNIAPHVDGIIALDDGSSDGSDRLLAACPQVIELLRNPVDRSGWDELAGFQRLVEAALRQGSEWILSIDADERLERNFRERAERVIRRGRRLGLRAFQVRVRELWDAPDRYRADGIWGVKWAPRLFQGRPGLRFGGRRLHEGKAPLPEGRLRYYPLADLFIYHLRMMRPEDRSSRRKRYEALDPGARFQPGLGYAYLTDERSLRLRPVPAARGYQE